MSEKKLADYSPAKQNAMRYPALLRLRCQAYAEHMAGMTIPPEIDAWARKMEFRAINSSAYAQWCAARKMVPSDDERATWSKTLGVWYNRLPLATAFMVIRWGEEPAHWLEQFTEADIERASNWFKKPGVVPGIVAAMKAGV
jgi:hypothetical protein